MIRAMNKVDLKPAAPLSAAPRQTEGELRLMAIPRLAAAGKWRVEAMRSLSEPLFLWFTKGQGRITIGGVTRGYSTHTAVFIPAGVMHGFEVGAQVFGTAVYFGRDPGLPLPKTPQLLRIREAQAQQEVNITLDMIQRELHADTTAHERAARAHLGLLGVWLERQIVKAAPEQVKPDAAKRLVTRYTALMEREFRSGAGVADLAAALGVTTTHLTRCCKQGCGKSALALLQDRRIFEARKLLAETDMPVSKVGAELGFTSAAYFTRAFQNLTGTSPSAFRRLQ